MKKPTRARPAVESLESMLLLSTAVAHAPELAKPAVHVAPPAAPTVSAEATVTLHGTLTGSGKVSGTSAKVSGSGNLGSVGKTTFTLTANLLDPPTSVTLSTKKGNLYLQASSALVGSGNSGSTTYSIVGGTKSYADATGSGTAVGTYSLAKNKLTVTIRFS